MAVTLTVGVNSWVTVAEADQYFEERWNAAAWAGLSLTAKQQLLITAYRWIFYSPLFNIPASSTSETVKTAQMELAWYIYNYFQEHEDRQAIYSQGVRDFKLSRWEEELDKGGMPDIIKEILFDELINEGGVFPRVSRDFEE
jgi:hypothetical protein